MITQKWLKIAQIWFLHDDQHHKLIARNWWLSFPMIIFGVLAILATELCSVTKMDETSRIVIGEKNHEFLAISSWCWSPCKNQIWAIFYRSLDKVHFVKPGFQKKVPLKVRAKFVEQKEKRLAEMEIENPEKAEAQREKKRWQNAETRLKGEKVWKKWLKNSKKNSKNFEKKNPKKNSKYF